MVALCPGRTRCNWFKREIAVCRRRNPCQSTGSSFGRKRIARYKNWARFNCTGVWRIARRIWAYFQVVIWRTWCSNQIRSINHGTYCYVGTIKCGLFRHGGHQGYLQGQDGCVGYTTSYRSRKVSIWDQCVKDPCCSNGNWPQCESFEQQPIDAWRRGDWRLCHIKGTHWRTWSEDCGIR